MNPSNHDYISFLLEHRALTFGTFTLKSGRVSPYFFNLEVFHDGRSLTQLGRYYAAAIDASGIPYDVLLGPAYKGIPLVASTSMALYTHHHQTIPYCFNRKESKTYGDGGDWVGAPLQGNVILVDDVITAGTTLHDMHERMQPLPATVRAMVIAFDREEYQTADQSIPIIRLTTLTDVLHYLKKDPSMCAHVTAIEAYHAQYGIQANRSTR